jgi:protein-S-isoprenylcysteine O-methyltransferase Ste14
MKSLKIFPLLIFFAILAGAFGQFYFFPFRLFNEPFNWLGLFLVISGITINIWSNVIFKKAQTKVKSNKKPTKLVKRGPYSFSRHPMYLGGVMVLFGLSLFFGSPITFIFPFLFIFIMEKFFIPGEEQALAKTFGKEYREYQKWTRKWI